MAEKQGWCVMPRVSMNEATTYHWPFEDDVFNYRQAGLSGIGVWRRKLSEFGDERGAELVRDSGLAVSSLSCAGGFTGSHGHSFDESFDDALAALELAAELHADCLVVMTGSRAGHTLKHAQRIVCEALRALGDEGNRLGVQIAVQPMHRQRGERWTFLTSLDLTLELIDRCNHPQVGMVFDLFHLWGERALTERIPEFARQVKLTSVCDMRAPARSDDDRCVPGEGVVPVGDVVRRLEEASYRGWYEIQVHGEPCWSSNYLQVLDDCRRGLQAACPELFACVDAAAPPADALTPPSDAAPVAQPADQPTPPL